jgi:hypothetical protein
MKIESPNKTYETQHSNKVKRAAKGVAGVIDNFLNPYQNHKGYFGGGSHNENVVLRAKTYRSDHFHDYHELNDSGSNNLERFSYIPKDPSEIKDNQKRIDARLEESGKFAMKYQDVLEADARASMERDDNRKAA